jgi:hypothetical protein
MNELEEILSRHRSFWRRGAADAPLVGTSRWPCVSMAHFAWGLDEPEGLLQPEMLRVEHFLPQYEALFQATGRARRRPVLACVPPRAIPWFEDRVRYRILSAEWIHLREAAARGLAR